MPVNASSINLVCPKTHYTDIVIQLPTISRRPSTFRASQSHKLPLVLNGMKVEKWDDKRDGPVSEQAMLDKLRQQGYSATRYTFYPGTVFDYHKHGVSKKDSIARGKFLFKMDGEEVVLEAGDMLEVPKGKEHYAEVVGDEPVVFFDATKRL